MYTYKFKGGENKVPVTGTAKYLSNYSYAVGENLNQWTPVELAVFRVVFVFFLIQIVPWHPDFYQQLFAINWLNPHFKSLLDLIAFLPQLIPAPKWGAWSFINWYIYIGIALVSSLAWGYIDKSTKEYNLLHYLLRAAIRYKVGLGLILYGFYMLFQQHMPEPSLSNLHTNYGDLFAWKLYFQTTAINPWYESFLGFVEILAGVLILYPKTVTFGTGLVIGFLGNVAMVNLFYDVGDQLYVNFLLIASFYLFSYDIPRLYTLLVKGTKAFGKKYYPEWTNGRVKLVRQLLRATSLLIVLLAGVRAYALFDHPYKLPQQPGINGSYGYYVATQFKLNNEVIPYSTTDPNRWQDVIFEKWSTISIKINKPILVDVTDGDAINENDLERNYEIAGAGGRHYFHYTKDPSANIISLQNKNINHRKERWTLSYLFPSDSTMLLKGSNEKNDSVHVELLRVHKKYFMYEGRRNRVKL
jgi:hypothetical protein